MILITGGRGTVATNLATLLHAHDQPIRVGSADPTKLTNLPDHTPTTPLNLADPTTFAPALTGITSVFLYANPTHIDEFIHTAHTHAVTHIVLLSSTSTLTDNPHHDALATTHLNVEKALLAGPIPTTILRPGAFAANAGAWAWPIKAGQPVNLPYPGAYTEPIHEKDIAQCAFAALTEPAHRGGAHTLSGPATMTFREQLDQLGDALGRKITVHGVTDEQWKTQMADYIPEPVADSLLALWRSSDGKPGQPTDGVRHLTGRPARTFATWADEHRADFEN